MSYEEYLWESSRLAFPSNPTFQEQTNHIKIEYKFIGSRLLDEVIETGDVESYDQPANFILSYL